MRLRSFPSIVVWVAVSALLPGCSPPPPGADEVEAPGATATASTGVDPALEARKSPQEGPAGSGGRLPGARAAAADRPGERPLSEERKDDGEEERKRREFHAGIEADAVRAGLSDDPLRNLAILEGFITRIEGTQAAKGLEPLIEENRKQRQALERPWRLAEWKDVDLKKSVELLWPRDVEAESFRLEDDGVLVVGPSTARPVEDEGGEGGDDAEEEGACIALGDDRWRDVVLQFEAQVHDAESVYLGVREHITEEGKSRFTWKDLGGLDVPGAERREGVWRKLLLTIEGRSMEIADATSGTSTRRDGVPLQPGRFGIRVTGTGVIKVRGMQARAKPRDGQPAAPATPPGGGSPAEQGRAEARRAEPGRGGSPGQVGPRRRLPGEGSLSWAEAEVLKSKTCPLDLKCNAPARSAARYLKVVELAYSTVGAELRRDFPAHELRKDRLRVHVFRTRDEYLDFTLKRRDVGGFFSHLDHAVRAYHGAFGLAGDTEGVLAHELTHQLQHRMLHSREVAPLWLTEGMAVYFGEGARIRSGSMELHLVPRHRLQSLKEAIAGKAYVPIRKLLLIRGGQDIGPCYDHGWGVLFWCLQGENSKYAKDKDRFGKKGAGRNVWKKYLEHLLSLSEPAPGNHWKREADHFVALVETETGLKIDAWQEKYRGFISSLPLPPLGEWKAGQEWDGMRDVGLSLRFPAGLGKVAEPRLRQYHREAAAAEAPGGVRLFLSVYGNPDPEVAPQELLEQIIRGYFTDMDFDPGLEGEEVAVQEGEGGLAGFQVAWTRFRGRFRRLPQFEAHPEPDPRPDPKAKPGKARGRGAAGQVPPNFPDTRRENEVRAALVATPERIYLLGLVGSEEAFGKVEPRFGEVLRSVKLKLE